MKRAGARPTRRQGRTARHLLAGVTMFAALAGCAVERGNYLQDPDGAVVVELPGDWHRVEAVDILTLAVERVPAQDRMILSHWVAGFNAVDGVAAGQFFTGTSANVSGVVRSRHIVSPELDTDPLSVNSLLGQMNDLALLPNGAELVAQRNQRGLSFPGKVNGLTTEFDFSTPTGIVTARYVVAVDVLRGQVYSMMLGCSSACYEANRPVIDQIADSFTVVEQASPRGR